MNCVHTSLQEIYQQKRNEHLKEMHAREEHMRAMFVQKVSSVYDNSSSLMAILYISVVQSLTVEKLNV